MAEYRASELYPQSVDRHKTEDMLHGRVGATDLRLSEIHTEYKTPQARTAKETSERAGIPFFGGCFSPLIFTRTFKAQRL